MRKFTLVTLAMMASASCFAQTTLWNGENTSITGKANAGFWPDANPELVDNPKKDGINTSDHCLKFVISNGNKVVKLPFREWITPSMNGSKRVSLMIKKGTNENVQVELSDPTDGSAGYWKKQVVWYGGGDKWQKLVFDFTSNGDFDKPGLMTITAQTGDVNTEQTVYIDNIVIEDAPRINGKLFSEYNAENPITGNLKLTGAWMKGESTNADGDWTPNSYNDFEYFNQLASAGVTSIDMRGTVTKDVDINQFFFKNPNTIVYADAAYDHANVVVGGNAASLELTDANAFNAPDGFTATSVTLKRDVRAGFNSFVLPFAVTANDLGATKVATFKETKGDIANFETVAEVEANKPFLTIDATEATSLSFDNKKIVATPETLADNDFVGVYVPTSGKGKYGINAKGNLQKGGADAKLNAFHAYLNVTDTNHAPARIALNGSTLTAINGITADKVADTAVYDISGRRVYGKLHKGLYIINGKKVVVK